MSTDWIAAAINMTGASINIFNTKIAAIVWIAGNVVTIWWGMETGTWSFFTQNAFFLMVNVATYFYRRRVESLRNDQETIKIL